LHLFVSMMADSTVDVARRIDCIHAAILPHRTRLPVLGAARELLDAGAGDRIAVGVIESIFDYRSKEWFGTATDAPKPPDWIAAPDEVLVFLLHLAEDAQEHPLPENLRQRIAQTSDAIKAELDSRK